MRRKGLGPCTVSHRCYMSAEAPAIMVCRNSSQTWPREAEGGSCCAEKLTPGDLGSVLGPEPSKGDNCQVGTSGSQPPRGRGT